MSFGHTHTHTYFPSNRRLPRLVYEGGVGLVQESAPYRELVGLLRLPRKGMVRPTGLQGKKYIKCHTPPLPCSCPLPSPPLPSPARALLRFQRLEPPRNPPQAQRERAGTPLSKEGEPKTSSWGFCPLPQPQLPKGPRNKVKLLGP